MADFAIILSEVTGIPSEHLYNAETGNRVLHPALTLTHKTAKNTKLIADRVTSVRTIHLQHLATNGARR